MSTPRHVQGSAWRARSTCEAGRGALLEVMLAAGGDAEALLVHKALRPQRALAVAHGPAGRVAVAVLKGSAARGDGEGGLPAGPRR